MIEHKISYRQFLESKILQTPKSGFKISGDMLHPSNMGHQKDIISWALDGGCRAIFARFGLGKTQIQLEICRIITSNIKELAVDDPKALIVLPLGVKGEFKKDAARLGIEVEYCRNQKEVDASTCSIILSNYERVRDGDIDLKSFICVSLDEGSVLRSLGSKTYIEFREKMKVVPFRYVATATPAPNDFIELLNYAAFLGIMDVSQAKTRFFKRNSEQADKLTLLANMEKEFWLWVSSWAIFITKPSDLGYSDEGYDLPPLNITYHRIETDSSEPVKNEDGTMAMFSKPVKGLSEGAREKKHTIQLRLDKAKEILGDSKEHWLLWHHLESERKAIEKQIPDVKSVYGGQSEEIKEDLLIAFGNGEYPILATKPQIAGSGSNFQKYCHNALFLGINDKFNEFIQAIHRIYRFQQDEACNVHIIYTDREINTLKNLQAKWKKYDELLEEQRKIIKRYGLSHGNYLQELKRDIGVKRKEYKTNMVTLAHNDAVLEHEMIPDNYFGLGFSSWPFSIMYEYSANYNDFGHNPDNDAFFEQMDYLIPHMYRTLQPGRVWAVHAKDRIVFGNFSGMGMPTLYPFSDDVVRAMTKHGFAYMGRITVVTDVVRENHQTYRLGWSEQCKDGSKMGAGVPEYLLLFRKLPSNTGNAYADIPVSKSKDEYSRAQWQIDAHGFWRSSGDRMLHPDELAAMTLKSAMSHMKRESISDVYDYERHVSIAKALDKSGKLPSTFMSVDPQSWHPEVWADVVRMRTLNTSQSKRQEQQHLCPMPFDIVDRIINRFSNPGDWIDDPFGGLFTIPFRSILLGRRCRSSELNEYYWKTGVRYCKEAEYKKAVPTLFDLVNKEVLATAI